MLFFERIFAAYYYMFVNIRNFFRRRKIKFMVERNEEHGALALLTAAQFLLLGILIIIAKKTFGFVIRPSYGIFYLLIYGILLLSQYVYFLSNRERRRKILDAYLTLKKPQKTGWSILAFCIISVPIMLFPILG